MENRSFVAWIGVCFLAAAACGKSSARSAAPMVPEAAMSAAPVEAPEPPAPSLPAPPDVGGAPSDATTTASGLAFKVLTPGAGKDHPSPTDKVKVQYTGWQKDGKMFDSSVLRGEPITIPLNGVIPGWTEGLGLMVVGEKRRLWIPAMLAYGERPRPGAPTGDLVFDVELIDILHGPKPPPVPTDVKVPPATAKKTDSGLAYRVLTPGTGSTHPGPASNVIAHYSGWTPDGKMFDSSVVRGEPVHFRLDGVIKGWAEGVQLMTKGEKARFWIPGALAYGDKPTRPGAPAGMLVFDIELIDFK